MNLPPLIMVSGKMGSGKDTVCGNLASEFYHSANTLYERKPMKEALCAELKTLLLTDINTHTEVFKRERFEKAQWRGQGIDIPPLPHETMTGGQLLQFWGEFRRQQNPYYWIHKRFANFDIARYHWIVPDLRYMNEFKHGASLNAVFIQVNRKTREVKDGRSESHASECELNRLPLPYFDFIIDNDGTIDDLAAEVKRIAQAIIEKANR